MRFKMFRRITRFQPEYSSPGRCPLISAGVGALKLLILLTLCLCVFSFSRVSAANQNSRTLQDAKLRIFDLNSNGILDPGEEQSFSSINGRILSGGVALDDMPVEEKRLYRLWREFLIESKSAQLSPQAARGKPANSPDIAKCYPDKVCDLPGQGKDRPENGGKAVRELRIFCTPSLETILNNAAVLYRKGHGSVRLAIEPLEDMEAVRRLTVLKEKADIIFVSDDALISRYLIPDYAGWSAVFHEDRLVLAYRASSKRAEEINGENWYRVLLSDGVRFAYLNPNISPLGYRTMICLRLADNYYSLSEPASVSIRDQLIKASPEQRVFSDTASMLYSLDKGEFDYAFLYASQAAQHGLKWIELPAEINLSRSDNADLYSKAKVEIIARTIREKTEVIGRPVIFSFALLKASGEDALAVEFLSFLFGNRASEAIPAEWKLMRPLRPDNRKAVPKALKKMME